MRNGRLQLSVVLAVCLGLAGVAALAHRGARGSSQASWSRERVPLEYLPSTDTVLVVSLGHRPAMADLFWVRSVLYFAAELQDRKQFEWLLQYLDLVIALDPQFQDIYRWGGSAFIVRTEKVTFEDVLLANRILEQGAQAFPDNWKIPHMAAANCSYYVRDPTPEQQRVLAECRTRYLTMAAWRPGAPFYVALTLSALKSGDPVEFCALLVDTYLMHAHDPVIREQVERRMIGGVCSEQLSGQRLRAKLAAFEGASAHYLPYLEPDLMVHVVSLRGIVPAITESK